LADKYDKMLINAMGVMDGIMNGVSIENSEKRMSRRLLRGKDFHINKRILQ
jgi:hypothetical protein